MKYYPGCDIEAFVKSMTLQQKIDLQAMQTFITSKAMPELGIPAMCIADGVTGINYIQVFLDRMCTLTEQASERKIRMSDSEEENERMEDDILRDVDKVFAESEPGTMRHEAAKAVMDTRPNGIQPTCFPSGALLGSTWNPQQVYECGKYLGREMAYSGVDVILGPNVEVQRDPLGGRGYECYSEDPFLVGKIAAAFINGMQSEGVAGCAKHFAANNQETNRSGIDVRVSERALREIYLQGFEKSIKDAKVGSIMMAHNNINGERCVESTYFMKDVIRDDWGYEGCIVSDWGAVKNEPVSIKAGLDMVLPMREWDIRKAVEEGQLAEEDLDRCVVRIIRMYEKLNGMTGRPNPSEYDDAPALKAVYDSIAEGTVLLKNDGLLPLEKDVKAAFWGKRSKQMIDCGGGSTQVFTKKTSSLLERAKEIAGSENCTFEVLDQDTQVLIYTAAYPGHEDSDNPSLYFEFEDRIRIASVLKEAKEKGIRTVVVLNTAGPADMRDWIAYADAILCLYLPGGEGGRAAADMIYGLAEPAGRLAQTFPVSYKDTPTCLNFPGFNGTVNYGEDIFVGYRYYDKKEIAPAFPFGHGLSYTTFELTAEDTPRTVHTEEDFSISVCVKVKNTGTRPGSEVVQIYAGQKHSYVLKPVRELKGFAKVKLQPGEEKTVEIVLDKHAFTHYDEQKGGWCIEPGQYELFVGTSSREFACVIPVTVCGKNPYGITGHTSINEIAADERAIEGLLTAVPDLRQRLPELLKKYDGMPLLEVYDDIMGDYSINPIHSSVVFRCALEKINSNM